METMSSDVMSAKRCAGLLCGVLISLGLPLSGLADWPYEIGWYTIDGGGGTSTGGQYTLTGTIGQPDAAWSIGGTYELLGGFQPGGPLCVVGFDDFARFAEGWLETGVGLAGDLDADNDVDLDDLRWFVDAWLSYCPAGWQLKE